MVAEIDNCIKMRQDCDESEKHEDALAVILEAAEDGHRRLSKREVQDSALEMLFAGHLPTSSAACSILQFLGSHPKVCLFYSFHFLVVCVFALLLIIWNAPEVGGYDYVRTALYGNMSLVEVPKCNVCDPKELKIGELLHNLNHLELCSNLG